MLSLMKFFHDIGRYEDAFGEINEITEGDYGELIRLGMEHIAPIFDEDEIIDGEDGKPVFGSQLDDAAREALEDDHWHELQTFSSPDMLEYYRLCRLYEYKYGIEPRDNKYVIAADIHYCYRLRCVSGSFVAAFDSDRHTTKLWFEFCPEDSYYNIDLIRCIHETLQFYSEHLNEIRRDLMDGPLVYLPMLSAPKGENDVRNGI
jgi:hypothetical protein